MSDAGLKKKKEKIIKKRNHGQVDERRKEKRGENISSDGRSNYTAQPSLTNGVKQTTGVSHFKARLKALQCYRCIPYIFRRNSAHHCAFQSPSSKKKKKPHKPRSRKTMHLKLGHCGGGAGTHTDRETRASLYNLYLCNRLARPPIRSSFSIFITFPWSSFHLPPPHPLQSEFTSRAH